jgi:tRNA(Ile)-lysidine synthase
LYHVSVHSLVERLLEHIQQQELFRAGDRVGIAVSGGIDSVALLRLLLELKGELGIVLSVVHFNHKLRGAESEADQEFVAKLACQHGLDFFCDSGDVEAQATGQHLSVEAAARDLRYAFFRSLLGSGEGSQTHLGANALGGLTGASGAKAQDRESVCRSAGSAAPPKSGTPSPILLTKIATGHTLDDQAETVLMRLVRGSGLRGLGGIHPRLLVEDDAGETSGEIIRPLLGVRRLELGQYLTALDQPWREDSTNTDVKFTRNRMRQVVLPVLEREFNPSVAHRLAELAEIARGEEDYWENEVAGWLGTTVQWSESEWAQPAPPLVQISAARSEVTPSLEDPGRVLMNASVSRAWLLTESVAVQRRLVKAIGDWAGIPLEFKHVEEILRFAAEEWGAGKKLSLPLGWKVAREPESLIFLTPDPPISDARNQEPIAQEYEYELPIPGRAIVSETGTVIEALRIKGRPQSTAYNSQYLLDPELLPGPLKVRNWRPGDRFWPAHTKSLKKIKELLAERKVAQSERRLWPVVVSGDEIVWVRGLPAPAKLDPKPGREAVLIRETALVEDPTS